MIPWWIVPIAMTITWAISSAIMFYFTSKYVNRKWKKTLDDKFIVIEKDKLEQIGVAIEKFLKE